MLADEVATYGSPTTDHTYKRVFLCDDEISLDFCNALLKISMPSVPLSARRVEVMSESVEAVFKNFQLLLRDANEQQNTKVDALFCADMDDARRESRVMQTRKSTQVQKPACILGEMQVEEQNFGIRLMSYMAKIMSASIIELKSDRIPPPVYGVGMCMWGDDSLSLAKGPPVFSSRDMEVDSNTNKFTEIAGCNVFLGKVQGVSPSDTRATIDGRLVASRNNLKKRVIRFFKSAELEGGGDGISLDVPETLTEWFERLSLEEKKVYLWLEFISLAPLMTERHVTESLNCLGDATVAYDGRQISAADIFKRAYSLIKFQIGADMSVDQIRSAYPDIWGLGEIFAAGSREAGVETAVKFIRRDMRRVVTAGLQTQVNELHDLLSDVDESLRQLVKDKLLADRVVTAELMQAVRDLERIGTVEPRATGTPPATQAPNRQIDTIKTEVMLRYAGGVSFEGLRAYVLGILPPGSGTPYRDEPELDAWINEKLDYVDNERAAAEITPFLKGGGALVEAEKQALNSFRAEHTYRRNQLAFDNWFQGVCDKPGALSPAKIAEINQAFQSLWHENSRMEVNVGIRRTSCGFYAVLAQVGAENNPPSRYAMRQDNGDASSYHVVTADGTGDLPDGHTALALVDDTSNPPRHYMFANNEATDTEVASLRSDIKASHNGKLAGLNAVPQDQRNASWQTTYGQCVAQLQYMNSNPESFNFDTIMTQYIADKYNRPVVIFSRDNEADVLHDVQISAPNSPELGHVGYNDLGKTVSAYVNGLHPGDIIGLEAQYMRASGMDLSAHRAENTTVRGVIASLIQNPRTICLIKERGHFRCLLPFQASSATS
jgi:hypothetical protein